MPVVLGRIAFSMSLIEYAPLGVRQVNSVFQALKNEMGGDPLYFRLTCNFGASIAKVGSDSAEVR